MSQQCYTGSKPTRTTSFIAPVCMSSTQQLPAMELPSSQQHAALPSFGRSHTNRDWREAACSQPMSFSTTGLVQQTRSLGSSESTLHSPSNAVPPYLRAYISKEPIFTSEQINAKNASKSSCSDTDGARSKDISFYSPSGTLFSQSRELGLLLDRIMSFDNTLKSFHSCFEALQDRMAERDDSAATSREDQRDLLADFESRIGDRIAAALGQEGKKMVEACVQELVNVANSTHEQRQQHQHWQTQLQESQNRLIREELSNWKTSVENTLREDMRELRSVVALQSQMLTTITEQNRSILVDHARILPSTLTRGYNARIVEQPGQNVVIKDKVASSAVLRSLSSGGEERGTSEGRAPHAFIDLTHLDEARSGSESTLSSPPVSLSCSCESCVCERMYGAEDCDSLQKSDNIKQKERQEQRRQAIERYVLASQR